MEISITATGMSLLFLSVLFILSYHSQADLIGDICKKSEFPDLCNSTLRSNPSSRTANVKGLARIMLYATLVKSTTTLNHINELLKKTNEVVLKDCLYICAEMYTSTLDDILLAIQNGGQIDGVISDAVDCEDTFAEEPKRKSPLTTENEVVKELAGLVGHIIASLG